jgi:hypothetical protein
MKGLWLVKSAVLLTVCSALCGALPAQEPGCLETSAMAAMARANSPAVLKDRKQKAGDSYRAQVIFAARTLEIDPQNKSAAELLLNLIPKDEVGPEQGVWLELDELDQCPSGRVPDSDLKQLWRPRDRLTRDLANAVLLVPKKMFAYVTYAPLSVNPESDNAMQMRRVCRAKHKQFVEAVNKLSLDDKKWFVEKIFNPNGCRTIAFPEQ